MPAKPTDSPAAWLWRELERRLSPEDYAALRAEWLRRCQARNRRVRYGREGA